MMEKVTKAVRLQRAAGDAENGFIILWAEPCTYI